MKSISFLFWGIITAAGALVLEIFIPTDNLTGILSAFSLAFFISPAIEEILKLSVLGKNLSLEKNGGHDLAKALFFGTGFFLVELALNIIRNNSTPPVLLLIGVLLVHLATSGLIGYFLFRKGGVSYFRFINIAVINILIHLSYNLAVFYYF